MKLKIKKNGFSTRRLLTFFIAGIFTLAYFAGTGNSKWIAVLAGAGFALGITDFAKRCPLMLSLNHLFARMKRKNAAQ